MGGDKEEYGKRMRIEEGRKNRREEYNIIYNIIVIIVYV